MATTPELVQHLLITAFCDELERLGVRTAVTSPGSRNTPLLLALAQRPKIGCWSQIDERAAGFFAVGAAKASGVPAVLACTSGTAAAELFPAVVEASEAGVPLIALTADRPAELRDCGAGQTIDQLKLYGPYVRWFFELELGVELEPGVRYVRAAACRAFERAVGPRPGPVQVNIPLRDPLVYDRPLGEPPGGRADGAPFLPIETGPLASDGLEEVSELVKRARRPVVVAGRLEGSREGCQRAGEAVAKAAEALGIPLLADPLSWARRGRAAVSHYDALLRPAALQAELEPDLVLRFGALPTSKPLRGWLARHRAAVQVGVHPLGELHDPDRTLDRLIVGDPPALCGRLAERGGAVEHAWLERWLELDRGAAGVLGGLLGTAYGELAAIAALYRLLPGEATLFVASSMPIRDLELLGGSRPDPPRVLANRGANGIDGTIASAFGALAAARQLGHGPVVALLGDVAFAHDLGALISARRLGLPLVVVLIDNGGGAIFDLLAVGSNPIAAPIYEQQIATPTGLDPAKAATLFGLRYQAPADLESFRAACQEALGREQPALICVRVSRDQGVAQRRAVADAIERGLT